METLINYAKLKRGYDHRIWRDQWVVYKSSLLVLVRQQFYSGKVISLHLYTVSLLNGQYIFPHINGCYFCFGIYFFICICLFWGARCFLMERCIFFVIIFTSLFWGWLYYVLGFIEIRILHLYLFFCVFLFSIYLWTKIGSRHMGFFVFRVNKGTHIEHMFSLFKW